MPILLTPDQQRLLRAVAAGKVKRHRRTKTGSPLDGEDRMDDPTSMPSGLRKVGGVMRAMKLRGLVRLPSTHDGVVWWPWELTDAGREAIAAVPTTRHDEAALEHLANVIIRANPTAGVGLVPAYALAEAVLDAGYRRIGDDRRA